MLRPASVNHAENNEHRQQLTSTNSPYFDGIGTDVSVSRFVIRHHGRYQSDMELLYLPSPNKKKIRDLLTPVVSTKKTSKFEKGRVLKFQKSKKCRTKSIEALRAWDTRTNSVELPLTAAMCICLYERGHFDQISAVERRAEILPQLVWRPAARKAPISTLDLRLWIEERVKGKKKWRSRTSKI